MEILVYVAARRHTKHQSVPVGPAPRMVFAPSREPQTLSSRAHLSSIAKRQCDLLSGTGGGMTKSKHRAIDPANVVKARWRDLWTVTASAGVPEVMEALRRYHQASITLAASGPRPAGRQGLGAEAMRPWDAHRSQDKA